MKLVLVLAILLFEYVLYSNGEETHVYLNGLNQAHHDNNIVGLDNGSMYPRIQRSSGTGLADIARFVDTKVKNYIVNTDETMTRLIFRVETFNGAPVVSAIKPSGIVYPGKAAVNNTFSNGTHVVELNIELTNTTTDIGNWTFTRNDTNTWDVTVQGESPVVITHQFFELGTNKALKDRELIASSRYRLTITISMHGEIKSKPICQLFSRNRINFVKMVELNRVTANVFEASNMSIVYEKFYVGIIGQDKSNNTVQRIDPRVIDPILFRIDVSPNTGEQIHINSTMNVTFTITSFANIKFEVNASDTLGLMLQTNPVYFDYVYKNKNVTRTFELQAGDVEASTTLKITVRYTYNRKTTDGLVIQRTFRVVTNSTPNSKNTDSPESSSSPTAAIAGGVSGLLLLLIAILIAVIVYKKLSAKRNMVSQDHLGAMPKNTKFTTEQ